MSAHYVTVPLPPKALQDILRHYDSEGLCYNFVVTGGVPPRTSETVLELWVDGSDTVHEVKLNVDGTWAASTKVQA